MFSSIEKNKYNINHFRLANVWTCVVHNFVNKNKIVNLVHLLETSSSPKGFAFVDSIHGSFIISFFPRDLLSFGFIVLGDQRGKKVETKQIAFVYGSRCTASIRYYSISNLYIYR